MVNKSAAKASYLMIIVGAVLAALGFTYKISYQQCLSLDGSNGVVALCDTDKSPIFFAVGLPIMIIGFVVLALAKKDAPVLQRIFGM